MMGYDTVYASCNLNLANRSLDLIEYIIYTTIAASLKWYLEEK